jgi:lysylphosphatidylglycerol synthetase-like protein (DUF2156 family)
VLLFLVVGMGVWGFLSNSPAQHSLASSGLRFYSLANVVAIACFWMTVGNGFSAKKILLLVPLWFLSLLIIIRIESTAKSLSASPSSASLSSYITVCCVFMLVIFSWIWAFPFHDSKLRSSLEAGQTQSLRRVHFVGVLVTGISLLLAIYMLWRMQSDIPNTEEVFAILKKCLFLLYLFLVARVLLPIPFIILREHNRGTSY